MEKYKYTEAELALLESAPVPLAIYQYVNGQVLTLALSNGFLELFGVSDLAQTKILMDKDKAHAVEKKVRKHCAK